MDRELAPDILSNRRRKTIIRVATFGGAAVGALFLLSWILEPSLDRADVSTSVVSRGPIEGAVQASGTVFPQYERTLSSPSDSRLLEVVRRAGSIVKKGDRVLALDSSELSLSLERTVRELGLADNRKNQMKLDMERTLVDLRSQLDIKTLRLEYYRSKSDQGKDMLEIGAISQDQMKQMALEEKIAAIEKEDLEKSIAGTQLSLQNQLDGVSTQVNALLREKADILRQLDLLGCRAARDGVVTWTVEQVGATIRRGDVVARLADLNSYRIEATLSDIHADRIRAGMPARVRLNDTTIPASIETVYPSVENGVLKVAVKLDDPAAAGLRPNLRVDVFLVTSRREGALKVRRGPFLAGGQTQEVFVLRGTTATRTTTTIGVLNDEEVEITGGLEEGDEIVISDTREFLHQSTITIH
jgi:HlyD family secretion protein